MPSLILASSSIYRREILNKLGLAYQSISPEIDESRLKNESIDELVIRLAYEKAEKVSLEYPNSLIIGSDQSAVIDGNILSKPLNIENAQQQLTLCSGKKVTFLTSLCLFDSTNKSYQLATVPYHVYFRQLSNTEITRYIELEKPLNCAGSFKVEGLGITLFEKLEGEDFNSLIGLPVIKLLEMLRNKGVSPLL